MTNIPDKIIEIFLNKQVPSLNDSYITQSLIDQGVSCCRKDVQRHAQLLSPSLFRLSVDENNTMSINVDPTIDICQAFLTGKCHVTIKRCDKLHLCRQFGHCKIQNCHYPHNFTHGENKNIVQRMHCEHINCQLLVKLIQLKKSFEQKFNSTQSLSNENLLKSDDIDKQIDVSYPSRRLTRQLNMEIIETNLNQMNIRIEKQFQEHENEYFRRCTIQLTEKNDIDKLLASPIITYRTIDIKFKRTKQLIDRTNFILKLFDNDKQIDIDESRLRLYISLLIGSSNSFTLCDLCTPNEKSYLVQCNGEFDFERICQQYETRRQLQGKNVILRQIYECDIVSIINIDESKTITYDDLEKILYSVQKYVFTFELINQYSAIVEFINKIAFKQWMSNEKIIMAKFQVKLIPQIDEVEDEIQMTPVTNSIENNPSTTSKPNSITITLRDDWSTVASNPIFKLEYQDYIRNQLGGEIEINNNQVTYVGQIPRLPRCSNDQAILVNKTNNYMQKFQYRKFRNLRPYHVNILRTNSNIVAFSRTQGNDYLIAVRSQKDLLELKDKLFPKKENNRTKHDTSPRNSPLHHSSSLVPLMSLQAATPPVTPSTVSKTIDSSIYLITKPEEILMFSIDKFEDRLQKYLQEMHHIEVIIERFTANKIIKGDNNRIRIKLSGETEDLNDGINDLTNLFLALHSREFNDKNDGNWTKIAEAVDIIQHHLILNELHCVCHKRTPTCIYVYYFDMAHPQFGIDEQKMEDLVRNNFSLATIIDNQQTISSKFTQEWTNLEKTIRQRDDYKKDICFSREENILYLFGITKLVKEFHQMFEKIKNKYIPQPCKINLSDKQLKLLMHGIPTNFNAFEKKYKALGCDVSFSRLQQNGEFYAPPDMHTTIKTALEELTRIFEITFTIDNTPFAILITKEPKRLLSLVKSKCYLQQKVQTQQHNISVPKSQAVNFEDEARSTQNTKETSINIGKSKITITIGDLTAQSVDMIVVCSTSDILRQSILEAAGFEVQAEYTLSNLNNQQMTVTSNGALPCKKIVFIPWKSDKSSLKSSLSIFVATAIKHAFDNGYKSIAFPSVGCGKFGFDPSLVAEYMIDEAEHQLISGSSSPIDVFFVLLSSQKNVYDAFIQHAMKVQTYSSKNIFKSNSNDNLNIKYDEKSVEITLISSNKNHLNECRNNIREFANSCLFKTQLTNKQDIIDWSQYTINSYYDYCLKKFVVPKFDFNTFTVELIGPQDGLHEAEKYFYELTTETLKQARIHAVSRGIIWSVEITPNSNRWEQYSFKINGLIEDSYLKKVPHVDFANDKQEIYRITFSRMEECHENDVRRVRRKAVDSLLPDTWEPSDQNCKRVLLQSCSEEYQKVFKRFDDTMKGKYEKIIKIERIQNERWLKQYAAHREDFKQRYNTLDERLLFHGCRDTSADEIIVKCFNRSFAGVNGVAYGRGVYFHTNASYSHSYAQPNSSGEHTMFLVRVLIGKTCRGTNTMVAPPTGYDTTTDGQDIFVTYHDAGAYAEHLIIYK